MIPALVKKAYSFAFFLKSSPLAYACAKLRPLPHRPSNALFAQVAEGLYNFFRRPRNILC